jgi:hypothetical protein
MTTYEFSKSDAAVYNSILSLPMSMLMCILGGEFITFVVAPAALGLACTFEWCPWPHVGVRHAVRIEWGRMYASVVL